MWPLHSRGDCAQLRTRPPFAALAMKYADELHPKRGDKIMLYKRGVIELILAGKKTLEIRSRRFKAGRYFLGCQAHIHASCQLGPAIRIDTAADFQRLRPSHLMASPGLPYPTTWALPIERVQSLSIPFRHTRGAITIVRYKP